MRIRDYTLDGFGHSLIRVVNAETECDCDQLSGFSSGLMNAESGYVSTESTTAHSGIFLED